MAPAVASGLRPVAAIARGRRPPRGAGLLGAAAIRARAGDMPPRPNWDASPRGAPCACGEHADDADARSCVLDAREGVATREVPRRVGRARVKAASSRPSRARSAAPRATNA